MKHCGELSLFKSYLFADHFSMLHSSVGQNWAKPQDFTPKLSASTESLLNAHAAGNDVLIQNENFSQFTKGEE